MPIVSSGKEYHTVTGYDRYRMKGHGLDWAHQPDPYKSYRGIDQIPLPEVSELPKLSLWGLNEKKLADTPRETFDLNRLSRILFLGYGFTAKARQTGYEFFYRSAASAGALYPIEIYLAVFDVGELDPGLYHYDIRSRALTLLRKGLFREFSAGAVENIPSADMSACFFITGIFYRTAWKYRARAMRYVLLDAGHVLENLRLSLNAERLPHSIHYDFDDQLLNRFLGLDEKRETCLASLPVYGQSSAIAEDVFPIESLPPDIQAASRVSSKESFYEEIDGICRAGRKIPDGMKEASDMMHEVGLESSEWMPMIRSEPIGNELGFSEAVFRRRSKRNYIEENLSSARFWRLLDFVGGAAGIGSPPTRQYGKCLATGFCAENIEGLDSGLYLLDETNIKIGRVRQGRFLRKMATACLDQEWLKNASLHFLFMTDLNELDKRWGPRGYRYAMMLAGRIGQAIYLGATALGLGSCGIGALYDGEAREVIGLNDDSALLYLVAAGAVKRL
ncbi:MAG TPA: SagB/ThcOx family dehydrogenase [Deltaproteobacteria bacterium]|nr:SagB/ThcOx family dehydrogenase [Deltaproteobacteria bacterium]